MRDEFLRKGFEAQTSVDRYRVYLGANRPMAHDDTIGRAVQPFACVTGFKPSVPINHSSDCWQTL